MTEEIIKKTENFVHEYMKKYDCSHDWQHVNRVVRQALALARMQSQTKQVDVLVVHLAALLHDVDDAKYVHHDDTKFSSENFLVGLGMDSARAAFVCRVADGVSFRKELLAEELHKQGTGDEDDWKWRQSCVELACVQDADRLDAIGAFGVLRCAAFSGARNRTLHTPKDRFIENITYEQYVQATDNSAATAISHFHEKLLQLAAKMKTDQGRQEAQRRHDFMLQFIRQVDCEFAFGDRADEK
ncbi:hypothetical protein LPJ66_004044 [Kickxella alabastrina]|uniref:Uncharacterized protein n=1 Tax=Kickxella alabastrina TaxID=61397 RepID=A0ACC1II36_9FUNG|nr:hypothetical protein LPJ66_004044 [Kickxella alabastrina]